MSDLSGKKAELDKDGILFDSNKAELDKDGISLSDDEYHGKSQEKTLQHETAETTRPLKSNRFKTLLIISVFFFIAAAGGIISYSLNKDKSDYNPYAYITPTVPQNVYTPEGDIILDPFMVLFASQDKRESGVLLAQLSLQVTPETAANIESDIFAVRSLILERLSRNAQIYSKNEIADILKKDLEDFKVKDVAFIQYEKR
ncbi:MAG: hypothetical protein JXM72_12070 [Deltaproteobacteria bacterium]|nr:hypothetical protein [Deltaproteobacteria bacterium]